MNQAVVPGARELVIPENVDKGTFKRPDTILGIMQMQQAQLMAIADAVRKSPLEMAKAMQAEQAAKQPERLRAKLVIIDGSSSGVDNRQWGFLARTYLVQNITNQWWYLPNESLWIAPWIGNMIWPLAAGTQMLRVTNQAPVGITQAAAVAGQTLTIQGESSRFGAIGGVVTT